MSTLALPLSPPQRVPRRLAVPAGLALLWVTASWAAWNLPLNNDVSWQLWVARQLRGGAVFGRDIAESNPPLWFWEALPASWAAERLCVDAGHLLIAGMMALNVGVLALCGALLPPRRGWALVGLAAVLFGLPLFDWAERDHLMAVTAMPYLLLAARRFEGTGAPRRLAAAIGLLAASGVALKPHFLLLPMAVEAWLYLLPARPRARDRWLMIRPETTALASGLLAYAVAVIVFAPAYLSRELPTVLAAYGAFKPPFTTLWTRQIYLPTWLLAAAALAFGRRRAPADARALAVGAAAFLISYAAQGKGFPYHALPVTMTASWSAWLLLPDGQRGVRTLAAAAIGWAALCAAIIGSFAPARLGPITPRLEALPAGGTLAVISAHSWDAFPLVEQRRLVWPMRGLLLWQFPTIARAPDTALARATRAGIVADLWCHPPDAILFDDPARSPAMPRNGFDYRSFVLGDRRATTLLAAYRETRRVGGASLWERARPVASQGIGCRAISMRPDLP